MSILAYVATITGTFLGAASFPQALKIFRSKSAKDISVTSLLIVEFGSFIWILYGLELHNFAIVIPNVLGFLVNTLVLLGWYLYGRKR